MENRYDVITSGYVSMDRIVKLQSPARVGFTSLISNRTSADICYGGCSVNISYDLCRLGVNAMPIMRVGRTMRRSALGASWRSRASLWRPPAWCPVSAPLCATCSRTTRGSISPCFIPEPWTAPWFSPCPITSSPVPGWA